MTVEYDWNLCTRDYKTNFKRLIALQFSKELYGYILLDSNLHWLYPVYKYDIFKFLWVLDLWLLSLSDRRNFLVESQITFIFLTNVIFMATRFLYCHDLIQLRTLACKNDRLVSIYPYDYNYAYSSTLYPIRGEYQIQSVCVCSCFYVFCVSAFPVIHVR